MIVLFTDFGVSAPYVGQLKAVLLQKAPEVPIVDLFNDAPCYDPKSSAYLLAAYIKDFPVDTVFLCVVDPDVGNKQRKPVAVRIDQRWFVGPDNGLFNMIALHSTSSGKADSVNVNNQWWHITWVPENLSSSFHGRDLFAPVAARLALGEMPPGVQQDYASQIDETWDSDLKKIVYIDSFGNAVTGVRASTLSPNATLSVKGVNISRARTFSDVPVGVGFFYVNANGLVEIAVNQGRADVLYQLTIGVEVNVG
jgi:S-adenosylmethionine hydrolase